MASHAVHGQRRVALVVDFLNSGGAERAALNMAAAAPRSECIVVAERRGGELADDPLADGVVFASGRDRRASRVTRIAWLHTALRRVRADVVISLLSPIVTGTAARLLGRPTIHWLQAPWSRTTAVGGVGPRAAAERRVLLAGLGGRAIVAAATPGLRHECMSLGIPESRLALLPNGLHIPRDIRRSARRNDEPARIVTVGRLEPQKRHDLTIEAVAELAKERSVSLTIVGSGRDEQELRALVQARDASSFIHFRGFVPSPYEALSEADLFVLSTDHEGFGNVIVEALACGLPVVVSDVPYGPGFILDKGRYGRLVAPNSVPALVDGMRRALESPLSDAAVERAQARAHAFDIGRVALRFEEIVDTLLVREAAVPRQLRGWS